MCALEELDLSCRKSLKKILERFVRLMKLKKPNMWQCEALVDFPPRSSNIVCLKEVGCLSMSVFVEDSGRIWWVDKSQKASHARM